MGSPPLGAVPLVAYTTIVVGAPYPNLRRFKFNSYTPVQHRARARAPGLYSPWRRSAGVEKAGILLGQWGHGIYWGVSIRASPIAGWFIDIYSGTSYELEDLGVPPILGPPHISFNNPHLTSKQSGNFTADFSVPLGLGDSSLNLWTYPPVIKRGTREHPPNKWCFNEDIIEVKQLNG
jgi:hypothetical protein